MPHPTPYPTSRATRIVTIRHILTMTLAITLTGSMHAQNPTTGSADEAPKKAVTITLPDWMPKVSGTIRAKGEYQPNEGEGRFEVRNARVALSGNVIPIVSYKAEIDLSDEGQIKMLDAYAGITPADRFLLRVGQMRVPFSIDAHRSPDVQYFANRSFIAKQVGNVRDVGFAATYTLPGLPLTLEAGTFNGSGLTNQVDYWTKTFNFSAKAQYVLSCGLTMQASVQRISPTGGAVYLYDGGLTLQRGRWTLEAEYLHKHYHNEGFSDVDAIDAFACYDLPLRRVLSGISFLARFDMMDDHSNGKLNSDGVLQIDDAARKRLTGGITLGLGRKKRTAELRLNYEKYFYDDIARAKPSERDKAVVELMVHF